MSDTVELISSDDSDSNEDVFPNVIKKLDFDEEMEEVNSERSLVTVKHDTSEFQFGQVIHISDLVRRLMFLQKRTVEPRFRLGYLSIVKKFLNSKLKLHVVCLGRFDDIEARLYGHLPWFNRLSGKSATTMFPEEVYRELYHIIVNCYNDEADEFILLEQITDGIAPEEYQMMYSTFLNKFTQNIKSLKDESPRIPSYSDASLHWISKKMKFVTLCDDEMST
ncbi:hypothetical protein L6452_09068 [Arctium lappa]|uniref:Uncharacterized protein n=1 Tax=Arctium lappa TaxID=4217 RepID=A0ACB9DJG0_ARCLA|nr:hypothetical protein L6452_09068 [Arctium lappa]